MERSPLEPSSPVLVALAVALAALGCSPAQSRARGTDHDTSSPAAPAPQPVLLRREQPLMGTSFQIQAVIADETAGAVAIDAAFAEIARVEALISEWQKTSEITAVNEGAGVGPVAVGPELLELVRRAVDLSKITRGAFDITFAGCGHLWSVRKQRIPTEGQVAECLPRVGYDKLVVDEERSTIFLPHEGMRIGSGAIGKGFGVDRAAAVLESHGITDYIVDGGGDIRVAGTKMGTPWTAGIAHPRRRGELLGRLQMTSGAVVTSGDYERFFERDGERYHHIIEPRTGRPASRSVAVTVIATNTTDADALATGIFVLGPVEGIALAESLEGVEALVVGPDLTLEMTDGFEARFHLEGVEPEGP